MYSASVGSVPPAGTGPTPPSGTDVRWRRRPAARRRPSRLTRAEPESESDEQRHPVTPATATAIAVCVVVTILFGVWPAPIVTFAHHAVLYSTSGR